MDDCASLPDRPADMGPRRVLVVDDDELNQRVLTGMLESLGCTPLVAVGGEEALGLLDAGVDLVLLDALMPGMDGFAVARRIRAGEHAEVPIIMVTTLSSREDRLRAVMAGVNDFIAKPVDKNELLVRMASILSLKDTRDQAQATLRDLRRTARELRQVQEELERQVQEEAVQLQDAHVRLRAEADLIGHIFRLSREGLALADARGDIIRVNLAFTAITGCEEHEVLGRSPRRFASDRHDDAFYAEMRRSLDETGQWSGEVWIRRKSGADCLVWLSIVVVPQSGGRPGHYLAMFHQVAGES